MEASDASEYDPSPECDLRLTNKQWQGQGLWKHLGERIHCCQRQDQGLWKAPSRGNTRGYGLGDLRKREHHRTIVGILVAMTLAQLTRDRKCRRLIVYGTLTLIGSDSSYYVEESEQVAGAVMMRETEPDWDW
jgi:hypothetical protein